MHARRARRAVALGVAVALVGGAFALTARASAPPELPAIDPDRLLASMLQTVGDDPAISGHVFARLDLGVPQLGDGVLAARQPGLASLLGDHRLRVWRSPEGLRVTELLPTGERSLFVDRTERRAWAWDSASFTAYRLAGGDEGTDPPAEPTPPSSAPFGGADPIDAVRLVLDAASSSTVVRMGKTDQVAGRDAYLLVVEPRAAETLIGRIEIAVDAERRLPLSIRLLPRSGEGAAIAISFTDVDFGPVDPSVYAFAPPEGAEIRTFPGPPGGRSHAGEYAPTDFRTFGRGWSAVVAVSVPSEAVREAGDGPGLLSLLPLSGSALSIRAVQRGDHVWIVYGAVPQPALAAVEPKLP